MKRARFIFMVWAALLLTACEHKELCRDHEAHTPNTKVLVRAEYEREWEYQSDDTDWESRKKWQKDFGKSYDKFRPGIPEGLRMIKFHLQSEESEMVNIAPAGETVRFEEGCYQLLFYNNDTHYLLFPHSDSFDDMTAVTRGRSRGSYRGSPLLGGAEENTVNQPDMLYASAVSFCRIEPTMGVDTLSVTLRPVVYTYAIFFEFTKGLEHIALARGALAGMAASVRISTVVPSSDSATFLFDCDKFEQGVAAQVMTFGISSDRVQWAEGADTPCFAVNLEVKLKNGKVLSRDFDITEQLKHQPRGGVLGIRGLEIPDDAAEGDSDFDVDVGDWGEFEDIDVPL